MLLWVATGCRDLPSGPGGCEGDVTITVSPDPVPVFSWTPDCAVGTLFVTDATQQPIWHVEGPVGANTIRPPVTYGVRPEGAVSELPAGELRNGFGYTVVAFVLTGTSANLSGRVAGRTNFRH